MFVVADLTVVVVVNDVAGGADCCSAFGFLLSESERLADEDLSRRLDSLLTLISSSSTSSSSSGMYSDERRLGDLDRPEFGVEILSDEVLRFVVRIR
jgi:hypothetical protein